MGPPRGGRRGRRTASAAAVPAGTAATDRRAHPGSCQGLRRATQSISHVGAPMNPIGLISMQYARPFTAEHFPLLARMRALGFDFVELLVPEPGELDLAETRRALQQAGLGVVLAARVNLQRNLASDDPAAHRAGVDYLRYTADCASALGAAVVGGPLTGNPLVFAGRPPAPVAEAQRLARKARCVAGLQEAGDHAASCGITLAIEPLNRFESDVLCTTQQAMELLDA